MNVASARRLAQIALRFLGRDFLCRILLDVLCAGVPCHDVSYRIERVDGIFLHAIHERVELFFGSLHGRLARSIVAHSNGCEGNSPSESERASHSVPSIQSNHWKK